MAMKLTVNGELIDPVELVNARFKRVNPDSGELNYLIGYLLQGDPDEMDRALTSLEHHRKKMRELEIMREVGAA